MRSKKEVVKKFRYLSERVMVLQKYVDLLEKKRDFPMDYDDCGIISELQTKKTERNILLWVIDNKNDKL